MCSSSTKHDGKATAWDFKGCLASNELKILMSARKKPEISTKKKRQSRRYDKVEALRSEPEKCETVSAPVPLRFNSFKQDLLTPSTKKTCSVLHEVSIF